MNIEEILDDINDLLDRSRPIPFAAHKVLVDADRMRELLNAAHLSVPAEIKHAKMIEADCDRILNEAHDKAESIIQNAEAHAKHLVSEQIILQEAKKRALDMLTKAQNGSNDIKQAAEKYVDNLLTDAENYFQNNLQEVIQTKARINNVKK